MKLYKTILFAISVFIITGIVGCSKIARDSAKLSKKDGIWEIQSMTISYENDSNKVITENYKNNGFFLLYNSKWYKHSLNMLDRYYGEVKITDLSINDYFPMIKTFNWYVIDGKIMIFEGEFLDVKIREYTFKRKGDEMTLEYKGKNNYLYYSIAPEAHITETFNLKRYDF